MVTADRYHRSLVTNNHFRDPCRDHADPELAGVIAFDDRDIQKLQNNLFHAARVTAAGQMAAALAHELSQPLTAVINSVNATKRLLTRGDRTSLLTALEVTDEAVEQALRAGEIVRSLRQFLDRHEKERRIELIPALIEEASVLALRSIAPLAVNITFEFDDAAVLRSLERLLQSANFEPVVFDRPDAFLMEARTFKAGCVLLDVRLPGTSGLEVQAQLLTMRSDLAIIVVTGQGDIQTAVRAMKARAADFLEKPYGDEALLGSIEAAFGRETDFDIADAVRRVATLSTREREVLDGLLAGRPNKLIAYDLGISVRTVEVHRARMMERLSLRQLSEVIRLGVMARLSVSPSAKTRKN
jgi:two-component system, LuxR family, response regulator FixJ